MEDDSLTYTAKGKLYARLVKANKDDPEKGRIWPDEVPEELRAEAYDAYMNFYHYTPEIEPPTTAD